MIIRELEKFNVEKQRKANFKTTTTNAGAPHHTPPAFTHTPTQPADHPFRFASGP